MSDASQAVTKPPQAFYWLTGTALVWNLLGVGAYVAQVTMSPEALAALPAAERALYEDVPTWATAAFAIAVNGGALGCLLLLLRKSLAAPILVASLAAVVVQLYHSLFIANSIAVYGPGGMVMPAMIVIIAVLLVWYAMHAKKHNWLG